MAQQDAERARFVVMKADQVQFAPLESPLARHSPHGFREKQPLFKCGEGQE